jgi:hypothetical protein
MKASIAHKITQACLAIGVLVISSTTYAQEPRFDECVGGGVSSPLGDGRNDVNVGGHAESGMSMAS